MTKRKYLLDTPYSEIDAFVRDCGQTTYRAKQIVKWAYQKRVPAFLSCSDMPADLRNKLDRQFSLRTLELVSKKVSDIDGTTRFDFKASDGEIVPCVFLPRKDRNVVCISSQIGCSVSCSFCWSGRTKFKRNLSKGEMIEEIFQVEHYTNKKVDGVLFMGMGEPLLNYDNVVSAVKAIVDPQMLGIGKRHVTISTSGLVPMIQKLKGERLGVRLALSLHAPDDETRRKLMPRGSSSDVREMLKAAVEYSRHDKSRLTVEYILISGVNDTLHSAQKLVKLLRELTCSKDAVQVNLIPYNQCEGSRWSSPDEFAVQKFRDVLTRSGLIAIIRQAKGKDIGAACGQLDGDSNG